METTQLDHFRDLLVQRRRHLARQINEIAEDVQPQVTTELYPSAPADQLDLGAEISENTRLLGTAELEQRQLDQINAALERLERGAYGVCDGCGVEISERRLELVPETTMCMDCKKAAEQEAAARKKGP